MRKRKCTWNISKPDEFDFPSENLYCGVVIEDDTQSYCPEHLIEEKQYLEDWDAWTIANRESNRKNPWHSVRECTRCGFEMPEAWGGNTYEENGIFQTTDGHGADVKISGGYGEFIDGTQQIAKLCKPCGFALLEFLNLDENGEKK